jgi:penicillin-binding protein 1A
MTFDSVSKKKATECTPAAAKIEVTIQTMTDPATKQKTYLTTDGYDPNATDDTHKCNDVKPFVNSVSVSKNGGFKIKVSVTQGTHALQIINVTVAGTAAGSINVSGSGTYELAYTGSASGMQTVSATVTDTALYTSDPPVSTNFNFN